MTIPVVIGQSPQQTTGSELIGGPLPQVLSGQYIQFTGSLTNGIKVQSFAFAALAGDGPPTVTGGFAKWNVVDRPQRVGMTVLTGYDPITLEIPLLFDAVARGNQDIERDLERLEWMGGRGRLFEGTSVGHAGQGDSPLIQVFTTNRAGAQVPLVPLQYQTADLRWVIANDGISYATTPPDVLRAATGQRIRQKVTVTLLQHVAAPGDTLDSAATRRRARRQQQGHFKTFPVTRQHNTIRKIAAFDAHNPTHAAAVAILNANRDNKKLHLGRSVDADLTQHLPLGTHIKVPLSVIRG